MHGAGRGAIAEGQQLGPYRILAALGSGGMGEVYRAVDTRLDRDVAIKVLPEQLAEDKDCIERFAREARAVSALNHPNICTLYDVGEHEGLRFIVMELLEGERLDERLKRGPLPAESARKYALQIANALGKAHAKGVVHRDLKPGNVMITRSDAKILDFGLAKVAGLRTGDLTELNAVMGTPGYMAPEQIRGEACDARTDVYALGLLLREMLTGSNEHRGDATAAAAMPRELGRIVERCLAHAPGERWQSAGDLATVLEWAAERKPAPAADRRGWYVGGSIAAFVAAAALAVPLLSGSGTTAREAIQFSFGAPENRRLIFDLPAVSPDGRQVVFTLQDQSGATALWVRPLGSAARPIAGSEGGEHPFWAPDGESIGFFADGKLKRVAVAGGLPQVLADAPGFASGTWGRGGDIVYSPANRTQLLRVSATGGAPEVVTAVNESRGENSHRFPLFLPDGRRFLFTARSSEDTGVYVGSLDSAEVTRVLTAQSNAVYVEPGYLLFSRDGTLLAQRFDLEALALTGDTFAIARIERTSASAWSGFSASENGALLAYIPETSASTQLKWYDRAGESLGAVGEPEHYDSPRISSDATRVTVSIADSDTGNRDIWIVDLASGLRSRWTTHPANDSDAVWSVDDTAIAFASDRTPRSSIFTRAVDAASEERLLLTPGMGHAFPTSWSADGQWLAYQLVTEGAPTNSDIHFLPTSGDPQPRPFLTSDFAERRAVFSPDARWVAYTSDKSGAQEVYVRSVDGSIDRRISADGGAEPTWRRDGREIFFLAPGGKLMAADITGGESLNVAVPHALFDACTTTAGTYTPHPSGDRFLFACPSDSADRSLAVVVDWQAAFGLAP